MSKNTWLAFVVLVVFAIGVAIAIPIFLPPTPGVTYANYSRIEKGMTREQIEALLGKPDVAEPTDVFLKGESRDITRALSDLIQDTVEFKDLARKTSCEWKSHAGEVWVLCDHDGRVERWSWNGWPDERTGFEKFRDRMPWVAHDPPMPMLHIF